MAIPPSKRRIVAPPDLRRDFRIGCQSGQAGRGCDGRPRHRVRHWRARLRGSLKECRNASTAVSAVTALDNERCIFASKNAQPGRSSRLPKPFWLSRSCPSLCIVASLPVPAVVGTAATERFFEGCCRTVPPASFPDWPKAPPRPLPRQWRSRRRYRGRNRLNSCKAAGLAVFQRGIVLHQRRTTRGPRTVRPGRQTSSKRRRALRNACPQDLPAYLPISASSYGVLLKSAAFRKTARGHTENEFHSSLLLSFSASFSAGAPHTYSRSKGQVAQCRLPPFFAHSSQGTGMTSTPAL